ncbi:MAG: tRNA (adenosine(37)-N6)-dimethylallyltransferase MiaA [Planctomycetota bacterium]
MSAAAPPILCITGTTGTGKNSIGILVAEALDTEVISLDSMKVYRGMDVGTAKPDAADLGRVRHHLIDVIDPDDRMDLARFIGLAEAAVAELAARGRDAVAVGGTAMYLNGLVYGVHDGPSRDEGFRAALREERDRIGVAALHARLAALDPASAARIDPHDYRRIERALEVAATGERPLGESERRWFREPRHRALLRILTWPREELRQRIDRRIDRMLEEGWIEEVSRIEAGGGFSEEAAMALGYREILAHLAGDLGRERMVERIKTKTWQFARRQLTWMKKYRDGEVILLSAADTHESVAARLLSDWAAFKSRP